MRPQDEAMIVVSLLAFAGFLIGLVIYAAQRVAA